MLNIGNITANHNLFYIVVKLERILDFFRINVFTSISNDNIFSTTRQHNIMLVVHPTQITSLKEAIFCKDFLCFFWHVVVTLHDHRTTYNNFADSIFVLINNFDFFVRAKIHSDTFNLEVFFWI